MKIDATKYKRGNVVCYKGEIYTFLHAGMSPIYATIAKRGSTGDRRISAPLRELSLYKGGLHAIS